MNQDERLGAVIDNYRKYFGDTADVVIDAGTRDGEDAEYIRQKLNAQRVIAIDPNPAAVYRTSLHYPDFEVLELAVSDKPGIAKFDQIISDREDYAGSSSLTRITTFPNSVHNTITVKVARLDAVLKQLKIHDLVDVLKVDVEGYTYEALEGLGERINDVKLMHLETETFNRHPGHHDNIEVKRYMELHGFELVDVSYEWGPTIEDQVWVNTALALD